MSIDGVLDLLCCPGCRQPLARNGASVRCSTGHSFDLARQGYLNLSSRASPEHADTAEMLSARSRFLATGVFHPVSDTVLRVVAAGLPAALAPRVLEVGAGTGHYVSRLLDATSGRGLALDISPAAARRAARAHPALGAVVADVWATLPLPNAAIDVVLAVFAPRNVSEFARVLAPGGLLVVVTPEPEHLMELRTELALLQIQAGKGDRLAAALPAGLGGRTSQPCRYQMDLDESTLVDLVAMGPNAFHRDRAAISAQVQALPLPLTVTVAVSVDVWTRS